MGAPITLGEMPTNNANANANVNWFMVLLLFPGAPEKYNWHKKNKGALITTQQWSHLATLLV